jgi:hypothetical protein
VVVPTSLGVTGVRGNINLESPHPSPDSARRLSLIVPFHIDRAVCVALTIRLPGVAGKKF